MCKRVVSRIKSSLNSKLTGQNSVILTINTQGSSIINLILDLKRLKMSFITCIRMKREKFSGNTKLFKTSWVSNQQRIVQGEKNSISWT